MLIIYGNPLSSPTSKVRFVAHYLAIPYEFKIINLSAGEHLSEKFLAINPFGRVPAIIDDGFGLSESNAIIRYLADKKQSSLYPRDLQARAIVDQWLDYASQHIAVPTSKIMFNTYYYKFTSIPKDERSLQDGYQFLARNLPIVEQQLKKQTYLAGSTITLADLAMIAALDVCEMCEVDLTVYSALTTWRKNLMAESFYRQCHENYAAAFNQVLQSIK
ncbi:MAG: glutathione S-transferase family protein [Legionellales bacterium]|nr:glutathione S-transferase family protein [Legionellales bacterium]